MRTWPALDVERPDDADLFEAALVGQGVTALDADTVPDACRVFFASDADRRRAAAAIALQFPDLTIHSLDVADDDWVSRSQSSLRAVRVGDVIVAPPWDLPEADAGGIESHAAGRPLLVVIRPSMGFGTGHHATTRLCLDAMQRLSVRGRRVLDVGTGSGLLAIAARLLGADSVLGIDTDTDALEAATDNLALNPRAAGVVFEGADIRSLKSSAFDLIAANLTGALLVSAAGGLSALVSPGGDLVLSGFMHGEEHGVLRAYPDLAVSGRSEEDEWVCVTLHRT